jgi:thyroxine 5-deiodinase
MARIYARYCTARADATGNPASTPAAAAAVMTTVYVEEAHPVDGWALPGAQTPITFRQPRSTEERCDIARTFVRRFDFRLPLVVDTIANAADMAFDAWPERLYVVVDGVIVYKVRRPRWGGGGAGGEGGGKWSHGSLWLVVDSGTINGRIGSAPAAPPAVTSCALQQARLPSRRARDSIATHRGIGRPIRRHIGTAAS